LVGAIERAQKFIRKNNRAFVWRSDIVKFFDSVSHEIIVEIIAKKVFYRKARWLINEIIASYYLRPRIENSDSKLKYFSHQGIPIGNLTSQIFANIYLNEFDRFIKHSLKPQSYLRYGDDFILIDPRKAFLEACRDNAAGFLREALRLEINPKNDIIIRANKGLKFLGVEIFRAGRRLNKRNRKCVIAKLKAKNIASYKGLVDKHCNPKKRKRFNWIIFNKINEV